MQLISKLGTVHISDLWTLTCTRGSVALPLHKGMKTSRPKKVLVWWDSPFKFFTCFNTCSVIKIIDQHYWIVFNLIVASFFEWRMKYWARPDMGPWMHWCFSVKIISLFWEQVFLLLICDMIKGNETYVADIVFEILAKKEVKFLSFILFSVLINWS